MAGRTLTKIKQTSFNLIKAVKENKPISEIKDDLEKSLKDNDAISGAIKNLKGSIYFEVWSKPLLFLIEYNQQDNPKYHPMGDKNIHIEHVLPQAFEKNADWSVFHGDANIKKRVDTGANLTLLSGSKNIAASNYGFDKKIKAYDGTGLHSGSDTKVSSFKITQKIVEEYNSGTFDKRWTSEAMDNRWKWFCEQVNELFQVKICD
jgi:hypothetical protein